ncbi:daunorubicin resistance protein DrrA family ABC transporter ATP-binding protein [Lentzea sp. NBRC 105346]|uniref:ATP-binding cassette domain-containing protein n=1 Tax=Lentzea sp. NBRC 105346 TaxID=3032205 RepID=UPI0024A0A830|nr:ATP-binding cassette domain-containing protein [Lentzea sp. NBRC 105346]GLZ31334.1 daunorubicin resistance protein DrrA family ABC transporter ATP-binding protein [Lentzea sp. NBRC 105346]
MITAEGLVKSYRDVKALDGLDLDVPQGTVFGLLGPNGAGKTTAVRVLSTLTRPDAGRAVVGGHDVTARPHEVRRLIGLSGQHAAVDELLTGRENLELIGRLLRVGNVPVRVAELLEQFELTEVADRPAGTYSGGTARRLDLAAALVGRPEVLFLDEPTTGLDPRSRLALWGLITGLVADGTTVLLTTQYLEEADRLANRIAVVDAGKVIANGTPDELKAKIGGEQVEVVLPDSSGAPAAVEALSTVASGSVRADGEHVTAPVTGGAAALAEALRELDARGVAVADIALRKPTLDDVFLSLTGKKGS